MKKTIFIFLFIPYCSFSQINKDTVNLKKLEKCVDCQFKLDSLSKLYKMKVDGYSYEKNGQSERLTIYYRENNELRKTILYYRSL